MATKRNKRRSRKYGKFIRTKKGGRRSKKSKRKSNKKSKRGRKRRYNMKASAPKEFEVLEDRENIKKLLRRLGKSEGDYEFQDLAGNTKYINLFLLQNVKTRYGEEPENLYERVKREFGGKNIRIYRKCYPDISRLLPENIPNNKLIYKGHYQTDHYKYNKDHNIRPIESKGFEMMTAPYNIGADIPELYIDAYGTKSGNYETINKRLIGTNVSNSLEIYKDRLCELDTTGDDLVDVTDEFKIMTTLYVAYKYDGKFIPLIQNVNGVDEYSPALLPIENFIIFYDE